MHSKLYSHWRQIFIKYSSTISIPLLRIYDGYGYDCWLRSDIKNRSSKLALRGDNLVALVQYIIPSNCLDEKGYVALNVHYVCMRSILICPRRPYMTDGILIDCISFRVFLCSVAQRNSVRIHEPHCLCNVSITALQCCVRESRARAQSLATPPVFVTTCNNWIIRFSKGTILCDCQYDCVFRRERSTGYEHGGRFHTEYRLFDVCHVDCFKVKS